MSERSIRLDEKTAAEYGIRVLLPGTAEHAAYLRSKGQVEPAKPTVDIPEPEPTGPDVSHEIHEDGTWVVTRDGDFFADGQDAKDIPEVVALAESGHEPFAPSSGAPDEFDVPGKLALEGKNIQSMDDLRAYVEAGNVLTDIKGIGSATAKKLMKLL